MLRLRRVIFGLVLLLSFLCGKSFANILPASSYSSAWEGSHSFDDGNGLIGRIDFAVYDTKNLLADSEEEDLSNLFGATDKRYIYAYQVLTSNLSTKAITSFEVLDAGNQALDESIFSDKHTVDQSTFDKSYAKYGLGLDADSSLANAKWGFDGLLLKDTQRSWFLVFASDSEPTRGSYEVTPATGISIPSGQPSQTTPEPMSILLLGSGFFIVRRRRKSVRI